MKIVHSLWSKPGKISSGPGSEYMYSCGWPDKKYNYFSWALSVLQFKKYYEEVELVTDRAGYELLIGKLELPYTSAKVVLDDLNGYHERLWAIGKLYAYSIQEEPFIHADGDVFIWKKFDEGLESASLLCQRKEEGRNYNLYYSDIFIQMLQHFEFLPDVLDKSINRHKEIRAINAGIIGGHNLAFIKTYVRNAFEFIDRNTSKLEKIDISRSNIVFEQFLFRAMAEDAKEEISYFNSGAHDMVNDYADYTDIPGKTKFIHTPGAFKQVQHIPESLEYRFQTDYPEYYYKIMNLLRTYKI